MDNKISYQIYATLIDGFTDYLKSDVIWETYWGFSQEPPHTPEEFQQIQFQSFIDRINRVPFDSEPADKGTAFNELIDCLVEHRKPAKGFEFEKLFKTEVIHHPERMGINDNMDIAPAWDETRVTDELVGIKAKYNNREFTFDINLCREFSSYYKGALTQQFVEAILPTEFGNVRLYGYIDELLPLSCHDIKTTGRYSFGKFKDHAQHLVYPYCLMQNGMDIRTFEYNIAQIDKYGRWESFTESYAFVPERDIPILRAKVEDLIRFLNFHKNLIIDKKIAPIWSVA